MKKYIFFSFSTILFSMICSVNIVNGDSLQADPSVEILNKSHSAILVSYGSKNYTLNSNWNGLYTLKKPENSIRIHNKGPQDVDVAVQDPIIPLKPEAFIDVEIKPKAFIDTKKSNLNRVNKVIKITDK